MVAKKQASKKKVAKKRKPTQAERLASKKAVALPENWEEQMALDAKEEYQEESKVSGGSIVTLSTKDKRFSLGDDDLGSEIDVVVADSAFEHAYYDRPYDEDNPSPPACFAIGKVEKDLVPHPDSPKPQHDNCKDCPWNEFESAAVGKGKACKNKRRLALFAHGDDGLSTEQMVILPIAPTGLKNYAIYAKGVNAKLKRPTYAVVTTMAFSDKKSYPIVTHKMHSILEKDDVDRVFKHKGQVEDILLEPYDVSSYEEPVQKKKAAKKKRRSKMS